MVTIRPKLMTMRVGSGEKLSKPMTVRLGFPTTRRASLAVRGIGPRHASPKLAAAARRLRGAPLVTRASGSGDAGADDDTSSGEGMDMSLLLSRINEMKDREVRISLPPRRHIGWPELDLRRRKLGSAQHLQCALEASLYTLAGEQ